MNRLVGNMWIIDTAGLWLTHNSADNGTFHDMEIESVFVSSNTAAKLQLTVQSNTAQNIVVDEIINWSAYPSGTSSQRNYHSFRVNERVFVRVCQAGTGYLIIK